MLVMRVEGQEIGDAYERGKWQLPTRVNGLAGRAGDGEASMQHQLVSSCSCSSRKSAENTSILTQHSRVLYMRD